MVTIRSVNEIILNLLDFFKLAQPDLDIKPGTVARDLFVDAPASSLALLYDQLSGITNKSSLRLVVGSDLDKLAKNYGVLRKQASPSAGAAILTFSSINAPISINRGDVVTASNGFSFAVSVGTVVQPSAINFYRSVATKYSDQLAFAGITDPYAVQVNVTATSPGSSGNIGSYSLSKTSISGVSNVTNVNPFNGGTDQETDAAFRNRILSTFNGSSVGTALGYLNVALGTTGVGDAYVAGPGDPLMTRDGTITQKNSDGSLSVVSEGSGGKVDVIVLGSTLTQTTDSFIYQDKSNNNDPTSVKNNFVLGQIVADANKTVNRKRIDDIASGVLPTQPVDSILQVTGSISGSNFVAASTDIYGRVSGNYKLVKDVGIYGGSPWGFDTFTWINNHISDLSEDSVKGQFNGQDATTFTDILQVSNAQQNISITNENSTVTTDRSIIQLLHTPATNVTRVYNVNTGERYIVTNQNLDQTGTFNTTGRIQISGNTLPSPSNQLQVDYSWVVNFDQYSDFDGLQATNNPRSSVNSIDWGYASAIRKEKILFTQSVGNNFFVGNTSHPISTVISANSFLEINGTVSSVTSGTFVNRLAVVVNFLAAVPTTVDSVTWKNSNVELYATAQGNGSFSTATQVIGINVLYSTTIILPTDTTASSGDSVSVVLNTTNVFSTSSGQGSSSGTQVTIPSALINTLANNIVLSVAYIANVPNLFASSITSLPASRVSNGYMLSNNNGFTNFSVTNISRRENQIIQQNLSNQFFVEIAIPSTDFGLLSTQILSVVRLSDGFELWNANHLGTIVVGSSGNYQLIFSGFNTPAIADRVLVIYYVTDVKRFQPFSYGNYLIDTRSDNLSADPATGNFTVPMNKFKTQSGISFTVFQPNTDIILFSVTDGRLVDNGNGTASLTSVSVNFSTLTDIVNKKVKIVTPTILGGNTNTTNDGIYDITQYAISGNILTITTLLSKITPDQISVIRVSDGQELWNYTGTIDAANNRLLIPKSAAATVNDYVFVMFFNYQNLRQASTRVVGTTVDQVVNPGVITVSGTTLTKVDSVVFTATNTGLKLNLLQALNNALGLGTTGTLPSNVRIAKIIKAQKVSTVSQTNPIVLQTLATYDVKNTTIQNNLLYADSMLSNSALQTTDFVLPNTKNNTANLPTIGDQILVTFYYVTNNDSENINYTNNGTLYTNKKFVLINKIFAASGFKASQSTRLSLGSFTQPSLGARYKKVYDYLAPKQNERIVINYNYNQQITTVTFAIESSRPINADVLAKEAQDVLLDLTINVVITPSMISSTTTILQNLRNSLINTLTTNKLGQTVDQVTIINVAQGVSGIDRARILYFNVTGQTGQVLKIRAQNNQFFSANTIVINTETR